MTFPLLNDFGLHGLVVLALTGFTPFLILDIIGHPTLVTVPVVPVELADGDCNGVLAVDRIRTDLLFFADV